VRPPGPDTRTGVHTSKAAVPRERCSGQASGRSPKERLGLAQGLIQARFGRKRSKGTIDNLIDGVDGFSLAGTAPQNENARDKVEVDIIGVVVSLTLAVLSQHDTGNADRLATMTAQNSTKLFRRRSGCHEHNSFEQIHRIGVRPKNTGRPLNVSMTRINDLFRGKK